jgi:hypothetical protein
MRRYSLAVLLLIASLLAACGSSSAAQSGSGGRHIVVGDGSNGSRLTLHEGDTLVVRLHSTYWDIARPQPGGVLKLVDRAVHAVPISSGRCMPGMGCGTVVATFSVQHTGHARVVASRTSCGEAMGCSKAQSHYALTLDVT